MAIPVALAGIFATGAIVVPLVRRALFAIGFGLVSYVGVQALFDAIKAQMMGYLGGASSSILALLGLAKVDVAISLVFSALSIRLGFMGLNAAGNLIRPRWRWNDQ